MNGKQFCQNESFPRKWFFFAENEKQKLKNEETKILVFNEIKRSLIKKNHILKN